MATDRLALSLLLASTFAAPLGCKSGEGGKADGGDKPGEGEPNASGEGGAGAGEPAKPGEEADDPRALALPIPKASAPLAIKAKGGKALPTSLAKIQHLYALAATAKQPEWSATGKGEAKLSRDDDLDTAWVCEFGQATPCVLGFALPESAKVEIIRIYGAAGPRFRDYTGNPRLQQIRVHTDAGYVDVSLPDGANHAYVIFEQPVETQTIALELLGVHGGKSSKAAHFADVEIYGTDGVPRAPIVLDPSQAWVSWETTAWDDGKSGKHTVRQTFVEFARPEALASPRDPSSPPPSRRFTRATGVYGQAGDDYLLFEKLYGVAAACSEIDGSYLLFDRRNRMFYPLHELGGAGAPVYRHKEGRGFAVGWIDAERFTVKGVVEEAGVLAWKRPPKQLPEDPKALLAEWGFETTPMSRGGSLAEPGSGCSKTDSAGVARLVKAAKLASAGELDPAQWLGCSVGTDTLFASATCDATPQAYLISASDSLIGKWAHKQPDARGLRVRSTGDARLIELSTEGGASSVLYWVEQGSFAQVEKAGGLFVRPPATCTACADEWGALPAEDEGTGETGGTEEGVDEGEEGFGEEAFGEEELADEGEGEGEEAFEESGVVEDEAEPAELDEDEGALPEPTPPPRRAD